MNSWYVMDDLDQFQSTLSRWSLHVHRGQQCDPWRHSPSPELSVFSLRASVPAVLVPHVRLSWYYGPPCLLARGQTSQFCLVEEERPRKYVASGSGGLYPDWTFPGAWPATVLFPGHHEPCKSRGHESLLLMNTSMNWNSLSSKCPSHVIHNLYILQFNFRSSLRDAEVQLTSRMLP